MSNEGMHRIPERREGDATRKTLEDLQAELASVMEIMKKDRADVTDEERQRLKTLLSVAGEIQNIRMAEIEKKKRVA